MVSSSANTVEEYLDNLPADRRAELQKVREVVLKHLPKGIEEQMQYGMIGYVVPLSVYPPGYHCKKGEPLPFAALAAQKNYCSLYLMSLYSDPDGEEWIQGKFEQAGKKLDMGKSCIRFKRAEDLPLDVIGEAVGRVKIEDYIERYENRERDTGCA